MSGPDTRPASPPGVARPPLPRTPFVLLALMTVATLAGPLAIILTLRGGSVRAWPPDRPVEWVVLIGVVAVVAGLLTGCVAFSARARRREVDARRSAPARGAGR